MVWLEAIVSEADAVREMSRPEFEAYEKRVETALFKFERMIGEEDRADYDEVAAAARDHVNVRREILELGEEQRDLDRASDRDEVLAAPEALEEPANTSAGQGDEIGRSGSNDGVRPSAKSFELDESDVDWKAAVSKHGAQIVERANDILIEIDAARERLDRAEAEGRGTEAEELDYAAALNEAAKLALAGNSYMREVAETDEELRSAIVAGERGEGSNAATSASAGEDERQREGDDDAEHSSELADPADQELALETGDEQRRSGRRERDQEAATRSGETHRTDPAEQHVPRLEELERKVREDREQDRDRDDFER